MKDSWTEKLPGGDLLPLLIAGLSSTKEEKKKREREQTVTKKSMQRMLASAIVDESSSSGNNALSSSPAEVHHVFGELSILFPYFFFLARD